MSRSRWVLVLMLAMAPALAEALALKTTGFISTMGLAPQITAPSPFGLFHDLRWVQVFHNSWFSFAWESIAAIAFRSLVNTGLVLLVWPEKVARRPWLSVLRINLAFNTIGYVVLSPWSAVAVAASDTSLFWFTLGELAPLLFLSLVLQHGAIMADWWRRLPTWSEVGWAVVSFIVLSVDALVVYTTPGWWRVPVAAVVAATNAVLWRRLVLAAPRARRKRRWLRIPAASIAVVISAGALLAMGQLSTIGSVVASEPPNRINQLPAEGAKQEIVYVAGYDSALSGDPRTAGGLPVPLLLPGCGRQRTPVALPVAGHPPVPCRQRQTARRRGEFPVPAHASADSTGRAERGHPRCARLSCRLSALRRRRHGPAQSAGPTGPRVLPTGQRQLGLGIATGWLLREMFAVVRATSHSKVSPDEPFVRSVLDNAPFYRTSMLCPVSGVRSIAFLPFAGAAVAPPDNYAGIAVVELPGIHAGLLGEPGVQRRIIAFLNGRPSGTLPGAGYAAIQHAAGAWQAPPLPLGLNPRWHAGNLPDPTLGQQSCR